MPLPDHLTVKFSREPRDDPDTPSVAASAEWDSTAHVLAGIMHGDVLVSGAYRLSYNDDGERYWWLRQDPTEAHTEASWGFDAVEKAGPASYFLDEQGVCLVTLLDFREKARPIAQVLDVLAGGDPEFDEQRVPDTDNYYAVTGNVTAGDPPGVDQ